MNEEPKTTEQKEIKLNDWVRYYDANGVLKIGCVQYIINNEEQGVLLGLENGVTPLKTVAEIRSPEVSND